MVSIRSTGVFISGLACGVLLVLVHLWLGPEHTSGREGAAPHHLDIASPSVTSQGPTDAADPFPEPPWRTSNTLAARTVVSTGFARFEVHRVVRPDGTEAPDWLWTDERAHVNILVHLKEDNKYLMFLQTKYGLEGERFATVGGLFNAGENASACAARELLEETGLEAGSLVALGPPHGMRVQADRGGGLLHPFLARDCVPATKPSAAKSDDYERQRVRRLTLAELEAVLLSGRVGEAQWLATAALGALYERQHL